MWYVGAVISALKGSFGSAVGLAMSGAAGRCLEDTLGEIVIRGEVTTGGEWSGEG